MKWNALLAGCFAVALLGCGNALESAPVTDDTASVPASTPTSGKSDSFDGDTDAVWAQIAERCAPPTEDEEIVYSNDFEWGYTLEQMGEKYDEMYASGKRLDQRAYFDADAGTFKLPLTDSWGGDFEMPSRLIENVTLHIEHALERGYVNYVFFPDMGHSHVFIPQDAWDSHYSQFEVSEGSQRYAQMLDDPDIKFLYHTAEQLELLDENDEPLLDRQTQWRYQTRNLVGDNNWERRLDFLVEYESNANTAHDLEGHKYWGAGFNITANKNGCFPFEHNGEVFWYDLGMSDLPYDMSRSDGGDWNM